MHNALLAVYMLLLCCHCAGSALLYMLCMVVPFLLEL